VKVIIRVRKFGQIDDKELDYIIKLIQHCYGRIGKREKFELDLYLFPDSDSASNFMKQERAVLGIASAEFGHRFIATHDAWRGRPRIILRMDSLRSVQPLVRDGCIRHEVGHSVLHGSPEYYRFRIPSSLLSLGIEFDLSNEYLFNIVYLSSIAVKDYEVTRLLVNKGFLEDQIAYVSYLLKPEREELEAYELARNSREGMILYLLSYLRLIGCAAPLLRESRYRKEIQARLELGTAHISNDLRERLFEVGLGGMFLLGEDTFSNINFILDLLVRSVLRYVLKEYTPYASRSHEFRPKNSFNASGR